MLTTSLWLLISFLGAASCFRPSARVSIHQSSNLKMTFSSVVSGAIIASTLLGNNPQSLPRDFSSTTIMVSAETRQGLYREYAVEKSDGISDSELKRTYKTADETDESKNKYWTILAVLLAGSFIIPMVQYYWYVAEED